MLFNENEVVDYNNVIAHLDGYFLGFGNGPASIDETEILGIIRYVRAKETFPANGGLEAASPFKKVARFYCMFIAQRPILSAFGVEQVGEEIAQMENHQNVMVAYDIAVTCLHGATINRQDGDFVLEHKIQLSKHSYTDLIQASRSVTPQSHFHIMAVLFEQLAYRFNPGASYELVV